VDAVVLGYPGLVKTLCLDAIKSLKGARGQQNKSGRRPDMKLFIGDLTPWVTEDRILERFSQFGIVDSVVIVRDWQSGQSRRYGFVEMPKDREAKKAIRALNGSNLQGLNMKVAAKHRHVPC
jgi:RNA recognition motif-containing protein